MKYARQTPNACFAYALYQIGAIAEHALEEYEETVAPAISCGSGKQVWFCLRSWADRFGLSHDLLALAGGNADIALGMEAYAGKGIVYLGIESKSGKTWGHAVSFEDGYLMDCDKYGPGRPETEQELRERYWRDYGVTITEIQTCNV